MAKSKKKIQTNSKSQTVDKLANTMDGFDNFITRVGLNNDNALSAGFYAFNLMTRNRVQLEAAYRGSWIVGQVIEVIAEDMTKAGVDITTNKGDKNIKDLQAQISRKKIWGSLASMIRWGRLYGGAIAVMQIDGQDLSTPLKVDTVAKDQFLGLSVYDRWQLNPTLNEIIPTGPDMGLPKYYYIVTTAMTVSPDSVGPLSTEQMTGQIKVHHSRVIRNIGIELPFFQAITEMMWGESVLERMWDRMIAFDSATMSAANLIERANNRTVGIENLREIIAAGGKALEGLQAQFEMMRQFQVNEGLTLIDKEDTFTTSSYTFAGLSDLLLQFGQQLSGASGIPLVRLFGQSPAGLNSTGDSDLRTYYDNINSLQESSLREAWDLLLKVMWRSCFGQDLPDDLEFSFVSLWQMSSLDKATLAKTNAETIIGAHDAGMTSLSTSMKELRGMSGDTGLFSNITDEDIAEAEEAELEDPPQPDMEGAVKPEDPKAPKEPVKNLDSKPDSAFAKIKKWVGL